MIQKEKAAVLTIFVLEMKADDENAKMKIPMIRFQRKFKNM